MSRNHLLTFDYKVHFNLKICEKKIEYTDLDQVSENVEILWTFGLSLYGNFSYFHVIVGAVLVILANI